MDELNTQQREALERIDCPVVIQAGPGTGKTKTLVARLEHLVKSHGVKPEHILALTFTQKAVAEMRDRLKKQLPSIVFPHIYTFHAFAHGVLLRAGKSLTLIPDEDRQRILATVAEQYSDIKKREIPLIITRHKSSVTAKKNEMVEFYNSLLASQGYMDFDDMLLFLYELLETDSIVREQVQTQFKYIHVDEFQDTNMLQYRILQKAAEPENRLFVIGDPRQSIYSFRGANPEVFDYISWDYPNTVQIFLMDNYRFGKNILELSSGLFPDTPKMEAQVSERSEITVVDNLNEFTEADFIVNEICSQMGGIDQNNASQNSQLRFSDVAIIFRTQAFARILEQKFSDSAIPYQVIGSNALYEQKEVRCITAWLLYLYTNNPLFLETAKELSPKKITAEEQNQLENEAKTTSVSKLVQIIETICKLRESVKESAYKLRNLNQFIANLVQFDSYPDSIKRAVEYLIYLKDHEYYDPAGDKVTLMTIHTSKGLEFKTVFICGLEQGNIPLIRKDAETNEEEEKRLLYVAMTRAKERIFLMRARSRANQKTQPSIFESLFKTSFYKTLKDEAIEKVSKKIQKNDEKKAQMSLF